MKQKEQDSLRSIEARFEAVRLSSTFKRIRRSFALEQKKILDLGCSYGEHLSLFGSGSVGITTNREEVIFGKERDLLVRFGNVERLDELHLESDFEGIWANNLFEHLLSPHAFLMELKKTALPDAVLVLGVPVVPRIASLMFFRKFRGALADAHINFFTKETLRLTVERSGWRVVEARPFMSDSHIVDWFVSFFAPHIYIVAYNDSSFVYPEKKLKEWKDDGHYKNMLHITKQLSV